MKRSEIEHILAWLEQDMRANPLILVGERGVGKRHLLKKALARFDDQYVMHEATIREGDFYQFQDLVKRADEPIETHYRQSVLHALNEYTSDSHAVVLFKNFEYCDKEHLFLIDTVLKHIESSARTCNLVLSFNELDMTESDSMNRVIVKPMSHKAMCTWLKKNAFVKNADQSSIARVATLSQGNIGLGRIVCGILKNLGILEENGKRYRFSPGCSSRDIPPTLDELYRRQIETLDLHSRLSLECILPFGRAAHVNLIENVPEIHDAHQPTKAKADFQNLAKERCLIEETGTRDAGTLFDRSFELRTDHISRAVRNQSDRIGAYTNSIKLYLEEYLNDRSRFSSLSFVDQYEMLSFLGDIRKGACDKNFKAVVDLMEALLEKGFFARVCEVADIVLDAWDHKVERISSNDARFFDIYCWALHNLGKNDVLMSYQNSPLPCRARLVVARAIHDSGNPQGAIDYISQSEQSDEEYKPFSFLLIAAAYDWIGDNERTAHFLEAAKKRRDKISAKNLDAFDVLLAKNSLTGNLSLDEQGKDRMIAQCERYMENPSLLADSPLCKPKLECISNVGASLINDFKNIDMRKKGVAFLKFAEHGLTDLCDSEAYYTKNALALNCCFEEDFGKALEQYEAIGLHDGMPPFCWLIIKGNIWGIARILGREALVDSCRRKADTWLETAYGYPMRGDAEDVKSVRLIAQEHPDVGLPMRQYAINRGEFCLSRSYYDEAHAWYRCAREATAYSSNSEGLVTVRLAELEGNKPPEGFDGGDVKSLSHFFVKHHAFLCALMFWG